MIHQFFVHAETVFMNPLKSLTDPEADQDVRHAAPPLPRESGEAGEVRPVAQAPGRAVRDLLLRALILLVLVVSAPALARAQEGQGVTDDEVNAIAQKLYCPVCENITLDTCGTAACADWRYEIRLQLEQGMTEDEIVQDFVRRFGDRVVGTPLDPTLRALSLYTPWALVAAALIAAGVVLAKRRSATPVAAPSPSSSRFVDQFEQDLSS